MASIRGVMAPVASSDSAPAVSPSQPASYRRAMPRAATILATAIAILLTSCAGPCAEIAARRRELTERTAIAPGPHARVRVPLASANAILAALVRDPPLRTSLALPELGPFALAAGALSVVARSVELRPGPPGRLQFAIALEIDDDAAPVTTLDIVAEVAPELVHGADRSELVAGFGPANLLAATPRLGADAGRALADAITRWLPANLRDRLPRLLVERAARSLAEYLTGQAYSLLRRALLDRLGELTRVRIGLPALPIAATAVTTTPTALTVDITTDLPVRRGLDAVPPPGAAPADGAEVELSGSTVAELANWSIARGHLPQHYTRDLAPRTDGDYRPWFDFLADDRRRPVKVHIFEDRGGCSYYQVGLRLELAVSGDKLEVDVRDRFVESAAASAPLELALHIKQLLQGSVDRSYRAAADTRLTVGGRTFDARITSAHAAPEAVHFAFDLAPASEPR
jgi:hypothetical protein